MYSRGAMLGGGGVSDGYEVSTKRQRMIDPDPYFSGGPGAFGPYTYGAGMPYLGQPRTFPVVRLRGLPFNCSESDVYEFFAGLDVVDVLLVHKQGRFSGEAFVVLGAPMQVDFALQRDRQNMGRRYVEVFRCKKQDYYNAVAAEVNEPKVDDGAPPSGYSKGSSDKDHMEHTGILKLRGLPFSATKRDIIEFFRDYDLSESNVHIVTHSDGRATGEAFVEFSNTADSKAAMSKDKMMIGSRYVELFPSTREEASRAASRSSRH
uniref:TSA: Wollemia nobilis Ref_Wollemi_Transcript_11219_1353 transcribed RNA sequence n=2 Tax=Wollemia nobilis TaxID=56998 RepID=A0A0C9RM99_9CONI